MTGEQLAGAAVLVLLGIGLVVVGLSGSRGSLEFSLGAWTEDTTEPESWRRAHETIGRWFVAAGAVAFVGAVAVVFGTDRSVGPIVVAGSVALLVPVVVGVVRGLGQLEPPT